MRTKTLCRSHPEGHVDGCSTCDLSLILSPNDSFPGQLSSLASERISTEEIVAMPRVLPTFDELIAGPPQPLEAVAEVTVDNRLVIVLAIMANAELVAILAVLLGWWRP